ncbi:MAG TPA: DUF2059 domain-containing protein [Oculatellaceae cyanobacterium]
MNRKIGGIALATMSVLLISGQLAWSQSETNKDATDKRALIDQLLETKRATENAQFGFNLMMDQEIKAFNDALRERLNAQSSQSGPKTEEQKKAVIAQVDAEMEKYRGYILQEVDLKKIVQEVFAKMYDKYYTTEEIREQLAFYQSKLGQKTLDVTPKLTKEAVTIIDAQTKDGIKRAVQRLRDDLQAMEAPGANGQAVPVSK